MKIKLLIEKWNEKEKTKRNHRILLIRPEKNFFNIYLNIWNQLKETVKKLLTVIVVCIWKIDTWLLFAENLSVVSFLFTFVFLILFYKYMY